MKIHIDTPCVKREIEAEEVNFHASSNVLKIRYRKAGRKSMDTIFVSFEDEESASEALKNVAMQVHEGYSPILVGGGK